MGKIVDVPNRAMIGKAELIKCRGKDKGKYKLKEIGTDKFYCTSYGLINTFSPEYLKSYFGVEV